jgi:hypothetical protein
MRPRNRLLVTAALALAIATPATAQVTSGSLPQTDPWGVGWISANDGPLATTIWNNTDEATLGPLFGALKPRELAPSARQALRRVLMSKAKGPGGITLIPERLRLLEDLGETESAVDLRRRHRDQDWGKDADILSAEFNLAAGETDAACGAAARQADAAWRSIRALCAAVAKDIGGANVLVEQIAASDEASGLWLLGALPAINAPELKKPDGRYATPFEAAVSVAAKLPVPANALAGMRADVAAAIATNDDATPAQRRAALRAAVEGGKLKAADVAAVLALPADPAPAARGAAARPNVLTQALTSAADKEADVATQAAAYAAALKAAETLTDARIASLGLHAAIKALPRNDDTLAYADAFARAGLAAGDVALAGEWRKHLGSLPPEGQDAWANARLDLMLNLAGAKTDKPEELLDRMIAAVQPKPDAKPGAASSSGEQQLAIRRIENTRVLFLHVGLGRDLTGEQRTLLSSSRTAGRGVPDAAIARITTAARQDADGEAALAAIGQLGSDVSALSFAGLSDLLTQLNVIGMGKDADAIALEAMQAWKAF